MVYIICLYIISLPVALWVILICDENLSTLQKTRKVGKYIHANLLQYTAIYFYIHPGREITFTVSVPESRDMYCVLSSQFSFYFGLYLTIFIKNFL